MPKLNTREVENPQAGKKFNNEQGTYMISGLKGATYEKKLRELGLTTLEELLKLGTWCLECFKNAYRKKAHREHGGTRLGWHRDENQPVAGPHPDLDTYILRDHGSLDVNLQLYQVSIQQQSRLSVL